VRVGPLTLSLVDELTPTEAGAVRTFVLAFTSAVNVSTRQHVGGTDAWPPPWFGSITAGEPDVAERSREILRAGYGLSGSSSKTGPFQNGS
jgi:hypothetical protein